MLKRLLYVLLWAVLLLWFVFFTALGMDARDTSATFFLVFMGIVPTLIYFAIRYIVVGRAR